MLTKDQIHYLSAPFAPDEHDWRDGGGQTFAYIREDAIAERLNDVDPSWSWEIIALSRLDNVVICRGRLVVCGVSREGVGMERVNTANEAEKSAATDAFKRAARLFGVGGYLIRKPANVKDAAGLARWIGQPVPSPAPLSAPAPGESYVDVSQIAVKKTAKGGLFYVLGGVSLFSKHEQLLSDALEGLLPQEVGTYPLAKPLRVYYSQGEKYRDFVRLEVLGDSYDTPAAGPTPPSYLSMPASILKRDGDPQAAAARQAVAQALRDAGLEDRKEQDIVLKSLGISAFGDFAGTVGALLAIINPSEADMPL